MPTDIPSSVYKNAIDLNRYSNSVAKRLVVSYNRIILDSIKELQAINPASYRARDLRTIMGSLKTSLDGWVTEAAKSMKTEVTGLAESQIEFAVLEMMNQIKADVGDIIKDPLVSPQFAEAVVSVDPTELNMVTLSDDLQQKVGGRRGATFQLGAREGALVTLPNGESLEKAFRGLSLRSAERFRLEIQDGLLTGEPIERIVRNLIGRQGGLGFSTKAKSAAQIAAAGGKLTRLADHQIMALVRTSVNQVSNVATQQTYKANRNITDNFMFVATLDSRTSLVCAANDGKEFSYDDGPVPPLHFNCRSTTVAVPNWKKLKEVYGIERPDEPAMRASPDGLIPAKEKYGDWLYKQRITDDKGRTIGPGVAQIEALGRSRAVYFNRLAARKGGPDVAIRKLIREDGSEKTLEDLKAQYKLRAITSLKKIATEVPLNVPEGMEPVARRMFDSPGAEDIAKKSGGTRKMVSDSLTNLESLGGEAAENSRKMRLFIEREKIFLNFSAPDERFSAPIWGKRYLNDTLRESQKKAASFWKGALKALDEGKGRASQGLMRRVTESGLLAKRLDPFNLDRLLHPCRGLTLGYTNAISGVVNSQLAYTGSTVTKTGAKKIQRDIRNMFTKIKEYRAGGSDPLSYEDLVPWSTSVSGGESVKNKWFATMIHEIGHQVHFRAYQGGKFPRKYKKLGGDTLIGRYATKNDDELFAESFAHYVLSPESLKKNAPQLYAWVDDAMKILLK